MPKPGARSNTGSLRLVIVTPRFDPYVGGVETHVREVAPRLVRLGAEVTILTTDPSGLLPVDEELADIHVHRVPAVPRGSDYYWSPGIYRYLRRGGWDIIHCQGIHTLVPPLAMLAGIESKIPYVVTFHTGGHASRLRHRSRTVQWLAMVPLLRRAARLVAVSRFEADLFGRLPGLAGRPIEIIPNGAETPTIANVPLDAPGVDKLLVLSVGRLERYKGHQRVISALPSLARRRPGIRLGIVGTGPYHGELRRVATRLGVAELVDIVSIPSADRSAMTELLSRAGVVVLLSEYEAHPLAAMEALATGRPVVGTDATGLHELVECGLVRPVSAAAGPEEVAQAILDAIDAPPRTPIRLPTWDDCAASLMTIYRTIDESA
jgi:glycosyltransferase involved in cell wall biosynthesis